MEKLIKKPLVSEKNAVMNASGVYIFEVDMKASKDDIKKAMKESFGVKVSGVRTAVCRGRGKNTKFGRGPVPHWKKAIVQLAPGEKIALFEGA